MYAYVRVRVRACTRDYMHIPERCLIDISQGACMSRVPMCSYDTQLSTLLLLLFLLSYPSVACTQDKSQYRYRTGSSMYQSAARTTPLYKQRPLRLYNHMVLSND